MDTSFLLHITKEALYLILILSGPPVATAMLIGLTISILQATTQIQEQTLTFVPKMVTIVLILVFFGFVGLKELVKYTSDILQAFPEQFF